MQYYSSLAIAALIALLNLHWLCPCGTVHIIQPDPFRRDTSSDSCWTKHLYNLQGMLQNDSSYCPSRAVDSIFAHHRIILVGEPYHDNDRTNLRKARLINFLVKNDSFQVLAFESSFFDGIISDKLRNDGMSVPLLAKLALPHSWGFDEHISWMLRNITAASGRSRGVSLCGFDIFPTELTRRWLVQEFDTLLFRTDAEHRLPPIQTQRVREVLNAIASEKRSDADSVVFDGAYLMPELFDKLKSNPNPNGVPIDTLLIDYWKIATRGLFISFLYYRVYPLNGLTIPKSVLDSFPRLNYGELREQQMATNLDFLFSRVYPNRKILAWGANFHFQKNRPDTVLHLLNGNTYVVHRDQRSAVARLCRAEYWSDLFVLGVIAKKHSASSLTNDAPQGIGYPSLDFIVQEFLGDAECLVDLDGIRNSVQSNCRLVQFYTRLIGDDDILADWTLGFDAVLHL